MKEERPSIDLKSSQNAEAKANWGRQKLQYWNIVFADDESSPKTHVSKLKKWIEFYWRMKIN